MFISRDKKGLALLNANPDIHLHSFPPAIGQDGHVIAEGDAYLECQGKEGWLLTGDSTKLLGCLKGYLHHIAGALPETAVSAAPAPITTADNIFS